MTARALSLVAVIPLVAVLGCGDAPMRLSDEDVDRIAEKTTEKVMKRVLDQGTDDIAYRIHTKMKDLDRVGAPPAPPAPAPVAAVASIAAPAPSVALETPPPPPPPTSLTAALLPAATGTAPPSTSPPAAPAASPAPAAGTSPVIIALDEQKWSQPDLLAIARQRGIALDSTNGRDFAEEMLAFELSAVEATASGIDKEPEYLRRVAAASDELIAQALFRERVAAMGPVDDAMLKERYESQIGLFTSRENAQVEEYWAPQMDDVRKLIAELKPGLDLAKLEKDGKVPATVRMGGGRSKVQPGMYPPSTWAAIRSAKPGEFTEPEPRDNGYLTVRVMQYQPELVLPFERAREKLRGQVESERSQEALKAVESDAKRVIPVKLYPERFGTTDSLAVLAEVGDHKVLRQDVLRELQSLPDSYRQRFSTKEGFADLVDRVAQKVLFSLYAHQFQKDFMQRHAQELAQVEKQERVRTFLEQELGRRINVTDADVKAYYERHQADYKMEEAHLRNISLRASTPDEKKEAPAKALKVIEKLKSGEKFEELARQFSDDQETKNRGGDMGWLSPDQMPPEIREVVAHLQPGAMNPLPVQAMGAFHLIRLEAKRDRKPLDEVRTTIENIVRGNRQRDEFASLVKSWKAKHHVVENLDALKLPPPAPQMGAPAAKPRIQLIPGGK